LRGRRDVALSNRWHNQPSNLHMISGGQALQNNSAVFSQSEEIAES
jgi:hypothetical protein